jgi:hypothetical protein
MPQALSPATLRFIFALHVTSYPLLLRGRGNGILCEYILHLSDRQS